jgi:hypothetical protein
METSIQQKVNTWLSGNYDEETKAAIRNSSEKELVDAFYKDLEFGTGGLRGIVLPFLYTIVKVFDHCQRIKDSVTKQLQKKL